MLLGEGFLAGINEGQLENVFFWSVSLQTAEGPSAAVGLAAVRPRNSPASFPSPPSQGFFAVRVFIYLLKPSWEGEGV